MVKGFDVVRLNEPHSFGWTWPPRFPITAICPLVLHTDFPSFMIGPRFPPPVGRLGRSRRSPPVYPLTRNEGLAVPSRFLASFAALDFFARRLVCWLTKRTQHHFSPVAFSNSARFESRIVDDRSVQRSSSGLFTAKVMGGPSTCEARRFAENACARGWPLPRDPITSHAKSL
jgi:hypothetical protein